MMRTIRERERKAFWDGVAYTIAAQIGVAIVFMAGYMIG